MGKQVVLLGDLGTDHEGFHPTPVVAGSPDVLIDGKPAARVGDPLAPHSKPKHPPHPRAIATGSTTVLINGVPVAVTGSAISCGGVTIGSGSVVIGDTHTPASFPVTSSPKRSKVVERASATPSGHRGLQQHDDDWVSKSGSHYKSESELDHTESNCVASTTCVGPSDHSAQDTVEERPQSLEENADRDIFERAVRVLEAEIANIGAHVTLDGQARQTYAYQVRSMAEDLRDQARSGTITWKQAAEQAEEARNLIMDMIRGRSTPVGRALSQYIKSEGKTLNELIARKTQQLFGENAEFQSLSQSQRQAVYGAIVESAGKANPRVSATMRRLSNAGKGLILLSVGLSVYRVAVSENKVDAAIEEAVITGAGVGGGVAGGAVAGLACGPGAPVCVGIGAFVGGALAAFGVSFFW